MSGTEVSLEPQTATRCTSRWAKSVLIRKAEKKWGPWSAPQLEGAAAVVVVAAVVVAVVAALAQVLVLVLVVVNIRVLKVTKIVKFESIKYIVYRNVSLNVHFSYRANRTSKVCFWRSWLQLVLRKHLVVIAAFLPIPNKKGPCFQLLTFICFWDRWFSTINH